MRQQRTIQTFFVNSILSHAGLGLILMMGVALAVSFLLAREQASTDLQESAHAITQAFSDRIVDGDIRSVEAQLQELLHIREGEVAKILKTDYTRVYEPFNEVFSEVKPCPLTGKTCFDGYFGNARILFPVSMGENSENPYRYLYLSRAIHLNWTFLLTVFLVFAIGYLGLVMIFLRIAKIASGRLGKEISTWSQRLSANPKDITPLARPPFAELLPLKTAIEGLNSQIEQFEKTATDKAKLLLLRGIGHDILTPVSQLQLYLATLENSIDQEQNGEVLKKINDSLRKVTAIASQVRTLKESEPSRVSTDLVLAVAEEINSLRETDWLTSKSISLEFKSKQQVILSPFSKTEISRIISNLVQNATDASQNGATVNVDVGTSDGVTFFSVSDRGCGISEKSKGRVFDPDFTLKPSTGTGLGLAIVKYICDRHSAKIELESKMNQGTRIQISVPTNSGGIHV